MEQELLVTKEQLELAGALHDSLWQKIRAELTPEQLRLVQVFDGLEEWIRVLHSADTGSMERQRILDSFEECIQEALDVLPEAVWPLAVYDVYPERGAPETRQAHVESLKTAIFRALWELPIEERINAVSSISSMSMAS